MHESSSEPVPPRREKKIWKSIHKGPIECDCDGLIASIVDGDVTLHPGADVRITGMVKGDVFVHAGASALITGMVSGTVTGPGSFEIRGIVEGRRVRPE